MKRIIIPIVLILIMVSVLGCTAKDSTQNTVSTNEQEQFVFRFNTTAKNFTTIGDKHNQVFIDELVKRTNGKVKVEPYYSAALGSTAEAAIGGLQNKSFELLGFSTASFANYTEAFVPFDTPYLIKNENVVRDIVTGDIAKTMNERCIKDTGIRVLFFNTQGFRNIANSKKPIHTPDDLKGMKIRVQENPIHMEMIAALGGAPTPIPFAELFTALQQKVVDGQENPLTMLSQVKLYEVQKYLTMTKHLFLFAGCFINEEYFQSLPQDIQKAILEASEIAQEESLKELTEGNKILMDEISQKMEVTELNDEQYKLFRNKVVPMWESIAKNSDPEYFNDIKDRIEKINAKY